MSKGRKGKRKGRSGRGRRRNTGRRKKREGRKEEEDKEDEEEGGKKRLRGMRKKRFERRVFAVIMLSLVVVIIAAPAWYVMSGTGPMDDPAEEGTTIFFEGACLSCREFVEDYYEPWLKASQVPAPEKKNLEGDHAKTAREERHLFRKYYKVPDMYHKPIEVFIVTKDVTVILIGDIPRDLFDRLLSPENMSRMALSSDAYLYYQKDYLTTKEDYVLWGFKGEPRTLDISEPIGNYLDYFETTGKDLPVPDKYKFKEEADTDLVFVLVVAGSGILDGINPCAIAILIFFITFLYSTRGSRSKVMMMGSTYTMAIYTIYFLIGLGLFSVLSSFEAALIITMIGAVVVIVLGLISMRDYLFPHLPFTVEVPYSVRGKITSMIEKATLPTTLVIGLLIGAYTFPCSGAIYVVIVSLIAVKANFLVGLAYLLWYNLWFVMPLLAILAVASNKRVAERMRTWEARSARKLRAFSGVVMVALGVFIIVWYIIVKI